MLLSRYKILNQSFPNRFVYHIGAAEGFFSEYNNMILSMLYCLEHKIQFNLYSKDANFKYDKGWSDYFAPFCLETGTCSIHFLIGGRIPDLRIRFWER